MTDTPPAPQPTDTLPLYRDRAFLIVLAVAFGVRLIWMLVGPEVMEGEGTSYTRTAENLLRGRGFESQYGGPQTMYTLLFSLLIAVSKLLFVDSDSAARMVGVIAGSALVIPVFCIARTLWSRPAALAGGVLIAINPLLIGYSVAVYSEMTYILFVLSGAYFGLRALELGSLRYPLLAGITFALAYVTRPEGIVFLGIAAGAVLVATWLRAVAWRKGLAHATLIMVVGALVAAPYIGYLYKHTGELRLEGKNLINYTIIRRMETGMPYLEAAYGIDAQLDEVGPLLIPQRYATYTPYSASALEVLGRIPAHLKTNIGTFLQKLLPSYELGAPILLLLVIIGFFRSTWNRARLGGELFLLAVAGYALFVLSLAHFVLFRYTLPFYPFLILWAGHGLVELHGWTRQSLANMALTQTVARRGAAGIAALMVALYVAFGFLGTRYESELLMGMDEHLPVKEAGVWLRANDPDPSKKIMDSYGGVPYYADKIYMAYPYADSAQALRYLDKVNPDYLVLWTGMAHMRPFIGEWIANGVPSARAQLVYRKADARGGEMAIWRWNTAK